MASITVYSKMRTCVELRLYKTEKMKRGDGVAITNSHVIDRVVIKGVNRYLLDQDKNITLLGQLAKTEVKKDFWDAYMKEDDGSNSLIKKKQIFVAKNDAEAAAMLIEVPSFFTDMKTPADLKKENPQGRRLV